MDHKMRTPDRDELRSDSPEIKTPVLLGEREF